MRGNLRANNILIGFLLMGFMITIIMMTAAKEPEVEPSPKVAFHDHEVYEKEFKKVILKLNELITAYNQTARYLNNENHFENQSYDIELLDVPEVPE